MFFLLLSYFIIAFRLTLAFSYTIFLQVFLNLNIIFPDFSFPSFQFVSYSLKSSTSILAFSPCNYPPFVFSSLVFLNLYIIFLKLSFRSFRSYFLFTFRLTLVFSSTIFLLWSFSHSSLSFCLIFLQSSTSTSPFSCTFTLTSILHLQHFGEYFPWAVLAPGLGRADKGGSPRSLHSLTNANSRLAVHEFWVEVDRQR